MAAPTRAVAHVYARGCSKSCDGKEQSVVVSLELRLESVTISCEL